MPHRHWHVDIAYLNLGGTFYYMCSILDGYSRFIVHWEIRESMTEQDVETIIQRARERFPGETPRIISDNGLHHTSRRTVRSREGNLRRARPQTARSPREPSRQSQTFQCGRQMLY